jgi:Putative redox-active protein (C_GCAxxG_C_C)
MATIEEYASGRLLPAVKEVLSMLTSSDESLAGSPTGNTLLEKIGPADATLLTVKEAVQVIGASARCAVGERGCLKLLPQAAFSETVFLNELADAMVEAGKARMVTKEEAVATLDTYRRNPKLLSKVSGKPLKLCCTSHDTCLYWNMERRGLACIRRSGGDGSGERLTADGEARVEAEALALEAARRGEEYIARWRGCGPAAFAAITDTLGHGEDPNVREILKATFGLTGGTSISIGTCGAVAGAALAVSLSFGFTREDIEAEPTKAHRVIAAVAELDERVLERYGHIQCQEIQFAHWGKSFRFSHPEALAEFQAFSADERRSGFKCRKLTGAVSGWAVECILKHNPGFARGGRRQG